MKKLLLLSAVALLCVACKDSAQQSDSFVITGQVCLPDGYTAGLVVDTDTATSVSLCEDVVIKDGKFVMTGKADRPYPGTLMTNNLALIEQNHWPVDSVRWTYSEVFVSNGELQFVLDDLSSDEPKGRLTGTQVQADFNDLLDKGGKRDADPWAFIDSHPQSAVSVWLACQLTDRAYNLTAAQVAHLQQTITQCPDDTARFNRLQQKLEAAKVTVKDAPLVSLELVDTEGNTCQLTDVIPHDGRYVLIDFWASWCGICLYSMPEVAQIAADFKDRFCVVGVSIDTDADAWHKAMEKHPEPWPQYCTTEQGYQDLFTKYQVGRGVPYYLLVSPEGKVLFSPERPDEVRNYLSSLNNKQ